MAIMAKLIFCDKKHLMIFSKITIKFRDNKGKPQVQRYATLIIFLKNTNKISDNKEKGQVHEARLFLRSTSDIYGG
jgi:hypothetical protein